MKFARTISGERVSADVAEKGNTFLCPCCNASLILKQGEFRDWHFAHTKDAECDGFTERKMTEWHIKRQEEFPDDCREVRLETDGVVHIADVMTGNVIIEFQHSPMNNEMFEERSRFYSKFGTLVWVFDLREQWKGERINWNQREVGKDYGYFTWDYYSKMLGQYNFKDSSVLLFLELDDSGWGCLVNWNPCYMKYFSGKRFCHADFMTFVESIKDERPKEYILPENNEISKQRAIANARQAEERRRQDAIECINRLEPEVQKLEIDLNWAREIERSISKELNLKRDELQRNQRVMGWLV
jgi:hypothetical protein